MLTLGQTPPGMILCLGLVCAGLLGIGWYLEITWRTAALLGLVDVILIPLLLIVSNSPDPPGCIRLYASIEDWAWGMAWRVVVYAVCMGIVIGLLRGEAIRYPWLRRRRLRSTLSLLTVSGMLAVTIGDIYWVVGQFLLVAPLQTVTAWLFLLVLLPAYFPPLYDLLASGWGRRASSTTTIRLGSPHHARP